MNVSDWSETPQVHAVFPGPFASVATWPWTKRLPADGEKKNLNSYGLTFEPTMGVWPRRAVVQSSYGNLSVLICSELLEAKRIADLVKRAELVLVPSWNTDTSSYDHLIQSAGMYLHAIIGIANNGMYSDCRAWAPKHERWERDLCRLIERGVNDVVYVDIPLRSLRSFHRKHDLPIKSDSDPEWRPVPPGWTK